MRGGGRLYRADHCDHHSAGTIAYAQFAVERCSEIVIGIVCAIMGICSFLRDRSNKKWIESWKVAGRAISINATLYQAWRW